MKAFHNDSLIKEKYITRVQEHYQADEIIQGQYWQNGKGCAVGCTIHSYIHNKYESELGIPENIAHLQDLIFESLPNKLAKQFPLEFLSSIKVGADLKNVKNLFTIWMLTDKKYGVLQYAKDKKIIQDIADAFVQDMISPVSSEKWEELRKNAFYASVAASAYYINDEVAVAAYSVVEAAAVSAYYQLFRAADCTWFANVVLMKTAKSKWYIAASNKLIELLKNAN